MHISNWDEWAQKTIRVPMVVGHEYVGEIVEIGQEVSGFAHRRSRLRRRATSPAATAATAAPGAATCAATRSASA
jgi:NADPH:quinone reductase-like Zn-dependent oxidoreductase